MHRRKSACEQIQFQRKVIREEYVDLESKTVRPGKFNSNPKIIGDKGK